MTLTADVTDWQMEIITATEKFLCVMGGRRCGKSLCLQLRMLNNSMYFPGFKTLYLTPNGALCDELFLSMISDKYIYKRIKRITKQPQRKIVFGNGSSIIFQMFAGDSSKLRGMWFNEITIDELQSLDRNNSKESIMAIVMPMLMDKDGTLIVAGQYRGARCWWNKLWTEQKDNPKYRRWDIPSWKGWLFKDKGYYHPDIQAMREILPSVIFDQEIACIPSANPNAAFRPEDIDACTKGKKEESKKGHTYTIGVDLGRTVDPSAWVVIDLNTARIVHAELRPLGERHEVGAQKLKELAVKYNGAECFIDTTGGATGGKVTIDAYTKFYRDRLPSMRAVQMYQKNKARLIQNLILSIEQHEISIPAEFDELISQLEMYELKEDKWGNFSYSGPAGHQDDYCVALALALEGYKLGASGIKTADD